MYALHTNEEVYVLVLIFVTYSETSITRTPLGPQ